MNYVGDSTKASEMPIGWWVQHERREWPQVSTMQVTMVVLTWGGQHAKGVGLTKSIAGREVKDGDAACWSIWTALARKYYVPCTWYCSTYIVVEGGEGAVHCKAGECACDKRCPTLTPLVTTYYVHSSMYIVVWYGAGTETEYSIALDVSCCADSSAERAWSGAVYRPRSGVIGCPRQRLERPPSHRSRFPNAPSSCQRPGGLLSVGTTAVEALSASHGEVARPDAKQASRSGRGPAFLGWGGRACNGRPMRRTTHCG